MKIWHRWKNVYFTQSNAAQKVCMRDEQMDGDSDSPMCRSIRKAETKGRAGAAQERDDDTETASEMRGV